MQNKTGILEPLSVCFDCCHWLMLF